MFPDVSSVSLMATIEHSMTLLRRCLPGERWGKHALIQPKSSLVSGIWKNCEGPHFVELAYTWVHIPSAAGTLQLGIGLKSLTPCQCWCLHPLSLSLYLSLSLSLHLVVGLMCVTPADACPQAHQCVVVYGNCTLLSVQMLQNSDTIHCNDQESKLWEGWRLENSNTRHCLVLMPP